MHENIISPKLPVNSDYSSHLNHFRSCCLYRTDLKMPLNLENTGSFFLSAEIMGKERLYTQIINLTMQIEKDNFYVG